MQYILYNPVFTFIIIYINVLGLMLITYALFQSYRQDKYLQNRLKTILPEKVVEENDDMPKREALINIYQAKQKKPFFISKPLLILLSIIAVIAMGAGTLYEDRFSHITQLELFIIISTIFAYSVILGAIFVIKQIAQTRAKKSMINELPGAVQFLSQTISGGRTMTDAIGVVGQKFSGPLGEEFRLMEISIKLGTPYVDAVRDAAKRINMQEFYFFSIIIHVQNKTGSKIVDMLDELVQGLRDKISFEKKVSALSSEAKGNIIVIASLPWVVLTVLSFLNPDYVGFYFREPVGMLIFLMCTIVEIIGFVITKQMSRIDL